MRFFKSLIGFIVPVYVSAWLVKMTTSPEFRQFEQFAHTYRRPYDITGTEGQKRFQHFKQNLEFIRVSNENNKQYKLGINQFADQNFENICKKMFCGHFPITRPPQSSYELSTSPEHKIPATYDWKQMEKTSPVKNQGQCGSCWAFSTTGALESVLRIRHNKKVELSEQQLIDCSFSNGGCQGGLMDRAMDDINIMGGIQSSVDYPYQSKKNTCRIDYKKIIPEIKFIQYNYFKSYDIQDMKLKLVEYGPVCAAVEVDSLDFLFYKEGIFTENRRKHQLNHAVLLTGYHDEKSDIPYWSIKNSWGETWGEDGYMRLEIKKDGGEGVAGIHMHGVYVRKT